MKTLIKLTTKGLYCPGGDFYIDPWQPVSLALITHAHADHARWGHKHYLVQSGSLEILKYRLGDNIPAKTIEYREKVKIGDVWVSFHPAGHILGSSQIRIEYKDYVVVVSGDYKRSIDTSCEPFELVKCDLFVTESTFALPIYQWEPSESIGKAIFQWWQSNAQLQKPSVLFCYALGKAQRILHLLRNFTDQQVYIHGAIDPINKCYEKRGIPLLKARVVTQQEKKDYSQELILAPVSAFRSLWMKRFKHFSSAFVSGWMAVRGTRRRRGFDRGFTLSDHADWNDLLKTVKETGANKVWVAHGYADVFARYLREEHHIDAEPVLGFVKEEEED